MDEIKRCGRCGGVRDNNSSTDFDFVASCNCPRRGGPKFLAGAEPELGIDNLPGPGSGALEKILGH